MSVPVNVSAEGSVGIIELARPDKFNCLSLEIHECISRARESFEADRDIRSILICAQGKHFCTGADLTEDHWDAFFAFYVDTGSRKWGTPYLSREFFSLIGERMAQETLLVMARRNGRLIAGALNFIGGDALYGRNWGAVEHHPFLHFECCYYQAIEFAIVRGLARVEAGAQGEHKLARGYLPARTHSAHWIANPSFREAVAEYLCREREYVDRDIAALGEYAPFRHDGGNDDHREDEF